MGFSLQLSVWMILFGKPVSGIHAEAMKWRHPQIILSLFSLYHGLFIWSPIIVMSVLGLIHMAKRNPDHGMPFLIIFICQVYINACIITWWEAASFGGRQFTACFPLFCLGLIHFYNTFKSSIWKIIGWICVAWTLILFIEVVTGYIDLGIYYTFAEIWSFLPASLTKVVSNCPAYLQPNHQLTLAFVLEFILGTVLLLFLNIKLKKTSWIPGIRLVAGFIIILSFLHYFLIIAAIS